MLKLNQIKTSAKFNKFNTATREQRKAIEQQSLEFGRIIPQILVWEETKQVIYGDHLLKIAEKHPSLDYTITPISLANQKEAEVWITEYLLPQPIFLLWHKLVWTIDCEDFWEMKERARRTQGTRTDLSSDPEERLDSKEVVKIIAQKVGCKTTIIYNFKAVYYSGRKDLIKKCENGEMSISAAYEALKGKKKKTGNDEIPEGPPKLLPNWDVLTESSENKDIGNKDVMKENGTPPDPRPMLSKIQKAKVPDGAIWLAFYEDNGVFQVVKKSTDKTSKTVIKLDTYNYKAVKSGEKNVVILQADHINFSTESRKAYDDAEFKNADMEGKNGV